MPSVLKLPSRISEIATLKRVFNIESPSTVSVNVEILWIIFEGTRAVDILYLLQHAWHLHSRGCSSPTHWQRWHLYSTGCSIVLVFPPIYEDVGRKEGLRAASAVQIPHTSSNPTYGSVLAYETRMAKIIHNPPPFPPIVGS